jgi:hypothetical protein
MCTYSVLSITVLLVAGWQPMGAHIMALLLLLAVSTDSGKGWSVLQFIFVLQVKGPNVIKTLKKQKLAFEYLECYEYCKKDF